MKKDGKIGHLDRKGGGNGKKERKFRERKTEAQYAALMEAAVFVNDVAAFCDLDYYF